MNKLDISPKLPSFAPSTRSAGLQAIKSTLWVHDVSFPRSKISKVCIPQIVVKNQNLGNSGNIPQKTSKTLVGQSDIMLGNPAACIASWGQTHPSPPAGRSCPPRKSPNPRRSQRNWRLPYHRPPHTWRMWWNMMKSCQRRGDRTRDTLGVHTSRQNTMVFTAFTM